MVPIEAPTGQNPPLQGRDEPLMRLLRRENIDYEELENSILRQWPLPPRLITDGVNIDPEPPSQLFITDTTFRDGQQAFYIYYSIGDAVRLFRLLADLDNGSGRIIRSEFFLYTGRDRELVRTVRGLGLEWPRVIGWGRARVEDVRLVKEAGLDEMVMLMSISDIHIRYKFNSTRDRVVAKYLEAAEYALKEGIRLRCSLEDVTRSDVIGFVIPFVEKLLKLSERYGVEITIKLPDTTGIGVPYPFAPLPYSIPKLVWVFRRVLGIPSEFLEFHGHGDYYMAVPNAVAAWLYGASINNGTLLGIGERAGNVPIEALVIWYARIKGSFDGMNPRVISKIVEEFRSLNYQVPRYQPLVGENAFTTAAGIHVDAQLRNPMTYLSMDPSIIGREARILIGPYSGRSSIAYWLRRRGVEPTPELINAVYERVMRIYDDGLRREPLSDDELNKILSEVMMSQTMHS
ncbi:homocitrate synthase/isopropylmalate synthase family protein [Vulcanisaeta distributa]|uniref:Pyruvate carboxyltransferase n=1 Tax=Vulcanisaeta distributa (strain DSM 14429 / JCM 11212 / NBRC 100878 / IC-017) TaxID=572478 RepID=E1QSU4_VULDI|nr:pyruvate carboxyltransferase [Vulcanisaeta distributa]ADN49611.1 pyruvate carboxyltransferase [Vulcanisaeta distributa DSM 14429]